MRSGKPETTGELKRAVGYAIVLVSAFLGLLLLALLRGHPRSVIVFAWLVFASSALALEGFRRYRARALAEVEERLD